MFNFGFKESDVFSHKNFIEENEQDEFIDYSLDVFVFKKWIYVMINPELIIKFKNENYKKVNFKRTINVLEIDNCSFKYHNNEFCIIDDKPRMIENNMVILDNRYIKLTDKIIVNDNIIGDNILDGTDYFGTKFNINNNEIIILSGNKSDTFIYLNNQKLYNMEEENGLSLRFNDNFEPIFINTIMFYNNMIYLKDNEKFSSFFIMVNNSILSKGTVNIKEISLVYLNNNLKNEQLSNYQTNLNHKLLEETHPVSNNILKLDSQNSNSPLTNFKSNIFKSSFIQKPDNVSNEKKSIMLNNEMNNKQLLNDILENDILYLKNNYKSQLITYTVDYFELIDSSFDLSTLYKLIFEQDSARYLNVLSQMNTKLDEYASIDVKNIEETIKYFDQKIFYKGHKPLINVTYKYPLQGKDIYIEKSKEKVQNIINGIKLLTIQSKGIITDPSINNNKTELKEAHNNCDITTKHNNISNNDFTIDTTIMSNDAVTATTTTTTTTNNNNNNNNNTNVIINNNIKNDMYEVKTDSNPVIPLISTNTNNPMQNHKTFFTNFSNSNSVNIVSNPSDLFNNIIQQNTQNSINNVNSSTNVDTVLQSPTFSSNSTFGRFTNFKKI